MGYSQYFLASHLEKSKQRTQLNGSYSNFQDIFSGVPQVTYLFIILYDLFLDIEDLDMTNYAEGNTLDKDAATGGVL